MYLKKEDVGVIIGKFFGVGDVFIILMELYGLFVLSVVYGFCIMLICIVVVIFRILFDCVRRFFGRRDERIFFGFKKFDEIIGILDKRGF